MNYLNKKRRKTVIRNIEKEDIKRYINRVICLNKEIEIYKIYYNEILKTLLIIANKRIQIKRIINKNIIFYNSINDIKKEFIRLNEQDIIVDEEYINLKCVKTLYSNIIDKLFEIKEHLENEMEQKLQYIYGNNTGITIYNYDNKNNTIKIGFSKNFKERKYKKIIFKEDNKKIDILKSEEKESLNILKILNEDLQKLFNNYKRYKLLDKEYIEELRSVNANFYVNIDLYNITLTSKYNDNIHFEIKYNTYDDKYYIKCDDSDIFNYLNEIAPSLLNLIYIPIIECPTWSQEKLYNIRDNELNNTKIYKSKRYSK